MNSSKPKPELTASAPFFPLPFPSLLTPPPLPLPPRPFDDIRQESTPSVSPSDTGLSVLPTLKELPSNPSRRRTSTRGRGSLERSTGRQSMGWGCWLICMEVSFFFEIWGEERRRRESLGRVVRSSSFGRLAHLSSFVISFADPPLRFLFSQQLPDLKTDKVTEEPQTGSLDSSIHQPTWLKRPTSLPSLLSNS